MSTDCACQNQPTRRGLIGFFLGGGLLATFASFLYPVMRYFVPPPVADLGGDGAALGHRMPSLKFDETGWKPSPPTGRGLKSPEAG